MWVLWSGATRRHYVAIDDERRVRLGGFPTLCGRSVPWRDAVSWVRASMARRPCARCVAKSES